MLVPEFVVDGMRLEGLVGACVSGHAEVLNETDGREDTLPAASRASTANVYELPHAKPETAYDVEVVCPNCDPSRYTV